MSRASEFCYVAERKDGALLVGWPPGSNNDFYWTRDPEMALRITSEGRRHIGSVVQIGFRKILAG